MQRTSMIFGAWWHKHEAAKVAAARLVLARGRKHYMLRAFPMYTLPCLLPAAFFALCGDVEHDVLLVYIGSMLIIAALSSFVVCRMHWREYVRLAEQHPAAG